MENVGKTNTEINEVLSAESLVLDNKIEFEHDGARYRIRSPEPAEKMKAVKIKDEKYNELLGKRDAEGKLIYKLKNKLIELYKEQGIDINDYDLKFKELQEKIEQIQLKLAEKKGETDEEIEKLIAEIQILQATQFELIQKKGELLSYSIEDISFQTYTLQLIVECAEIFNEEKNIWSKVYASIDEFNGHRDEKLGRRFAFLSSKLFFSLYEEL
jgi:hypothetical protein